MKDLKVGERIIIECVETNEDKPFVCEKCFFYDILPFCPRRCSAANRKDRKNVIFKLEEQRNEKEDKNHNIHALMDNGCNTSYYLLTDRKSIRYIRR